MSEKSNNILDRILEESRKRESTESEKIVNAAMERDKIWDLINKKNSELKKAEERKDEAEIKFIEQNIEMLKEQKGLLTNRIKTLLDRT
jgi:hypothetical protein